MITDSRLHTKAYGKVFVDSIGAPQVYNLNAVEAFFADDNSPLEVELTSELKQESAYENTSP